MHYEKHPLGCVFEHDGHRYVRFGQGPAGFGGKIA